MPQVRLARMWILEFNCNARALHMHRCHALIEETFADTLADLPLLVLEFRIRSARVKRPCREIFGESADREQIKF